MISFRPGRRDEVGQVVALLADAAIDAKISPEELAAHLAAFDRMMAGGNTRVIVGLIDKTIVATYQIAVIFGLSLKAPIRAQIESVRVAMAFRGRGLGTRLMADACARAKAEGCTLVQLTSHRDRADAHRFYLRLGFTPTHLGYKRELA